MHELSVIKALIDSLQPYRKQPSQEQSSRRISNIVIEIGKLTCVDPERLQFCFDMVKADAQLSEVELEIHRVDGEARCNQC
jgi:hydrogenase nickel incorporation protein HypA/HybF